MKFVPFRLVRTCPFCESVSVRRSHRRGLFEQVVLRILLMRPYRCSSCNSRHYNFVFSQRGAPEPPASHK